jgi:hypothetical protein
MKRLGEDGAFMRWFVNTCPLFILTFTMLVSYFEPCYSSHVPMAFHSAVVWNVFALIIAIIRFFFFL